MRIIVPLSAALLLAGCSNQVTNQRAERTTAITAVDSEPFVARDVASFDEPWAMTFLPDGRMLVTTKPGKLFIVTQDGMKTEVGNVPSVDYGGQGGLGDVVLSPDFATDRMVYLSWIEPGSGDTRGAVVGRATLDGLTGGSPRLGAMQTVWTQRPKVEGKGHYSHRIVFSPDGQHMFIASGERQKFDPAQDDSNNLGTIVRLRPDGSVPADNPFVGKAGTLDQIWTTGHRNTLGIAFDNRGRLWNQEMGPKAGDEMNLIKATADYGYPVVSNGDHYDGRPIPDHSTRPEFEAPKVSWDRVTIAPSGLIFYDGDMFPSWRGSAFIGGLASKAIIRVAIDDSGSEPTAREAERFDMDARIREVEQGPDGALWVLQDGDGAKLLKLVPAG